MTAIPTDYTAEDVLSQIEQTDRRPTDMGYLRAIALALLVIATKSDLNTAELASAIDGVR